MKVVCLLLLCGMLTVCSSKADSTDMMVLEDVFQLSFTEASGLAYDDTNNTLLAVSDNSTITAQVFRLDLQGNILEEFSVSGYDLEAVALDPYENRIWLADEGSGLVFPLQNPEDGFTVSAAIDGNNGIEGIAFSNDRLYILKEKEPAGIFIADQAGTILDYLSLDFASDFSDLEYDRVNQRLLILSDQDKKLFILNDSFEPIESFSLEIEKPEGLAISTDGKALFIACDKNSRLYKYKF